jgi:hypothetical protein
LKLALETTEIARSNLALWNFAGTRERMSGIEIVPVDDFPSVRRLERRVHADRPGKPIFALWSLGRKVFDLFLKKLDLAVSHVDFDFREAFVQFVNFGGGCNGKSGDSFFK